MPSSEHERVNRRYSDNFRMNEVDMMKALRPYLGRVFLKHSRRQIDGSYAAKSGPTRSASGIDQATRTGAQHVLSEVRQIEVRESVKEDKTPTGPNRTSW